MDINNTTEPSWQDELLEFIEDDFEKQVLTVAMDKRTPESILQSVKEILREKLHEDKKSED